MQSQLMFEKACGLNCWCVILANDDLPTTFAGVTFGRPFAPLTPCSSPSPFLTQTSAYLYSISCELNFLHFFAPTPVLSSISPLVCTVHSLPPSLDYFSSWLPYSVLMRTQPQARRRRRPPAPTNRISNP